MLNIHIGRENLDKDKFMFDSIRQRLDRGKRVILVVPDQFTLQAEKNAFAYLNAPGLMNLEVLSFSRLGNRILGEVGGGNKTFINNYGKYMMISRIMLEENKGLKVFKDLEGSSDFVEKVNNFISEIKNHNITPENLEQIIQAEGNDSLLLRKLEDIEKIYKSYEQRMGKEQIDTADYLNLFISKISQSDFVKSSEFWIAGFDYLTPRNTDAVLELGKMSRHMNVVLTAQQGNSFFKSTNSLAEDLRSRALDSNLDSKIINIPDEYAKNTDGSQALAHLEEQYCSLNPKAYAGDKSPNLEFVSAANFYAEAETAAVKITQLIRDNQLRYRDILIICNDMDARASVIKRVFSEYGLPVFIDQRRGIHHNPVLEYITALLDISAEGMRQDFVFKLLKTGLTSTTNAQVEELENYAIKFKITGNKWKKEFRLTAGEYSDEELISLNEIREQVVRLISGFTDGFKQFKTAKDRASQLFKFLSEEALLPIKIIEYTKSLEENDELEYAEEMSQVWKVVVDILDQLA